MTGRYQGPDGTVIDTPAGGDHALVALGWVPLDPPAEAEDTRIPAGAPSKSWKVNHLKAYAAEQGIDLGSATKKDEILAMLVPEPSLSTLPVVPALAGEAAPSSPTE